MDDTKCIVIGRIGTHQRDIVYDINGVSPCINGISCEGGYNNQPRIILFDDDNEVHQEQPLASGDAMQRI